MINDDDFHPLRRQRLQDGVELSGKTSFHSVLLQHFPPFAEFQVNGIFLSQGSLPPFWGPTLRGGLGYHLKKTVCHVKQKNCPGCIVQKSCAYSYIFEGVAPDNRAFMRLYPNIPQPFVILTSMGDPSQITAGMEFQFGMRLFGRAIELFPYIVYSLLEIGKEGLGKDRIPYRIDSITQPACSSVVYKDGNHCLGGLQKESVGQVPQHLDSRLTIEFHTPTKLQVGGAQARKISFLDLIKAVNRRLSILSYFYGIPFEPSDAFSDDWTGVESVRVKSDQTRLYEVNRFSGRQQQKMTLRGLLGRITFEGKVAPYIPILKLAEICHVGKATSFGFGRIKLTIQD